MINGFFRYLANSQIASHYGRTFIFSLLPHLQCYFEKLFLVTFVISYMKFSHRKIVETSHDLNFGSLKPF